MSTTNTILVAKGKRGDSGYDTVRREDNETIQSRWINIGGTKLRGVNDKLYFSSQGDLIIVAYNSKDLTVRSFWNVTKNEGKLISIINLIFHPYLWIIAIIGACFLLGFKKDIKADEKFKLYAFGAYGGALVITFVYSLFDWRKDKIASNKVEEVKNSL
ncbi:MAG: hypothetical protein JNJ41_09825 [Bacteroidia bacterium]|nr:hypothetical protein [Bacteroidia bacterium]